jgi:hypothetical protein
MRKSRSYGGSPQSRESETHNGAVKSLYAKGCRSITLMKTRIRIRIELKSQILSPFPNHSEKSDPDLDSYQRDADPQH